MASSPPTSFWYAAASSASSGGLGAPQSRPMAAMGRNCGEPRPPLLALDAAAYQKLVGELDAVAALHAEPRGW